MLVTLYKTGEVSFSLLDANGFISRKRMKDLLLLAVVVVRTSNMKNFCRRLGDYVKKLLERACHKCSTITFPHSANHIIDLWRCRCRRRRHCWNCQSSLLRNKFLWPSQKTWNGLPDLSYIFRSISTLHEYLKMMEILVISIRKIEL